MSKNNAALIEAAKNGDNKAFEELMRLYQEDINNTAMFLLKNGEDAKDISQEVYIKLFKNLSQLQNTDAFASWVRIITINECKMFFRKNSHTAIPIEQTDDIEELLKTYQDENIEDIPHEKIDRVENDRILFSLIEELPEKYSRVLILYFYAEMSYTEIAAALKISEGTVKSRLFTAKKKMHNAIIAYEKKHDVVLHTKDVFGGIGRWLMQVFSQTDALSQTAVQIAPAAMNTVTTNAVTAVSTSFSNTVATRISIATASLSVAVCIGITANVFKSDSVNLPDKEESVSVSETAEQESSLYEEASLPELSEPSVLQSSEAVSIQPSVVYLREETEPSIIYRDREVVHEAEPSVVYVTSENERRYDKYTDITIDDGNIMKFRIYTESGEATMTLFSSDSYDIILPSYIDYEDKQIPVTRLTYNFLSIKDDEYDNSVSVTLKLPEKLESIPEDCFRGRNIETITGGKNVVSIGKCAFLGCGIKELNMCEVFPNVVEIGEEAFRDCPIEKLVLPEGLMRISINAFMDTNLKEVTAVSNIDGSLPIAETVHIIIPGSTIKYIQCPVWSDPEFFNKRIIEIKEMFLELQDKNAVFYDSGDGEYDTLITLLYTNIAAENLYLPEGMKKLIKYEFENIDYYRMYGINTKEAKIKNLYISSTITEIEPDAFTTVTGVIENIILPKAGRSKTDLLNLKKSILKSRQFRFVTENNDYILFTDPSADYPDGKYSLDNPKNYDRYDEEPEDYPNEADPVEEDPIEVDPIEEDPIEVDPIEEDPIEVDPIEEDPIEVNPIEEDLIEDETTAVSNNLSVDESKNT